MPDTIVLELGSVMRILDEAFDVLEDLHGKILPVDPDSGPARKNNPELAAVSRDLLRVGELCRLAGAEIYTAYYVLKGHTDPRLTREEA